VLGLLGLMASLYGHRRRIFFRVRALDADAGESGGTVIEAGGLPRTDYPGFADEFAGVVTAVQGDE
jgi:cytochrome c biogenesis protein